VVSISHLFIYPIKGCGGVAVQQWPLERTGLRHDREWMLIDEHDRFISQREEPKMALCRISQHTDGWHIRFDESVNTLKLPFKPEVGMPISVRIWDDQVEGITGWSESDSFFSNAIGRDVRLVYFSTQGHRRVDPRFATQPHFTFFSDGYPILLAGSASLDLLNSKLPVPIDWDRFRPNIVVQTLEAHIEDQWTSLAHQHFQLLLVKPCARCVVTTIDQRTALSGKEPLRTLAGYRQKENKILFGMNTLIASMQPEAHLRVGDILDPEGKD
jgi:uncharacterized protein